MRWNVPSTLDVLVVIILHHLFTFHLLSIETWMVSSLFSTGLQKISFGKAKIGLRRARERERGGNIRQPPLCSGSQSPSLSLSSTQMEPTSSVAAVLNKNMSTPSMKKLCVPLRLQRTFSEYLTPPRRQSSTIASSASTELTKGNSLPNGFGDCRESWESLSPEVIRRKAGKLEELANKCQRLNSVMGGIVTGSRHHEGNNFGVAAQKIESDISQTHIEYESTIQEMLEAEDALFDNLEQRLEKIEIQSRSIFQPLNLDCDNCGK